MSAVQNCRWREASLEIKRAPLALERVDARGRFEGYASVFGVVDLGRDMVMKGAFAATLKRRGAGGVRLLWRHDPAQPLGAWLALAEDQRGLRARGQLDLATPASRRAFAQMREGALDGLSIGYRALRQSRAGPGGVRRLHVIDLMEISLVDHPMLPQARVSPVAATGSKCAEARLDWRLAAFSVELSLLRLAQPERPSS
ncbi:MAG: phage prohead protease, family [Hyphomicrobiales bacterium]|nr:phage prohead protease, family [Hyphomicrobiales bacterium]